MHEQFGNAKYTHSRRRAEKIAKGAIFASAGLTVAVLVFIVGFILVRGFYSKGTYLYDVTSQTEKSFDGWEVVVNKKIRMEEMTFDVLYKAFTGEYIDWGKLSAQNFDLLPYAYQGGSGEQEGMLTALGAKEQDLSPMTETLASPREVLSAVAKTPGAIGLVPQGTELPRGVKPLRVRRVVLAVNPSVLRLEGNRALKIVTEAQASELLAGKVKSWREVGGTDDPVVVVPEGGDQGAVLAATPGAVGKTYWKNARSAGLPVLRIERTEGKANLTPSFIYEAPKMSGRVGGISTIILNTLLMIILTLVIATPIGVFAAIYLVEYARQGPLVKILRLGTETLAGIPSIIFGLFGMLFFVNILGWGIGMLSGVLTLTIMILPTIVRTSEEALKTVPLSLREGSLALGATKLQTTLKVVVPAAVPGILTGVILAIGRAVGETAALVFTMGSNYDLAHNLFSSARVLSVHVYLIIAEGISLDRAFATATILVFIIFAVNLATTKLIGRFNGMAGK